MDFSEEQQLCIQICELDNVKDELAQRLKELFINAKYLKPTDKYEDVQKKIKFAQLRKNIETYLKLGLRNTAGSQGISDYQLAVEMTTDAVFERFTPEEYSVLKKRKEVICVKIYRLRKSII